MARNIRGFYLREPSTKATIDGKEVLVKGFPIAYVASEKAEETNSINFAVCSLSKKDRTPDKYKPQATRLRAIGRLLAKHNKKVRRIEAGAEAKRRIVEFIANGDTFWGDKDHELLPLYPKQTMRAAKQWLEMHKG